MSSTTTKAAIRAAIASAVKGLTPDSLREYNFRYAPEFAQFTDFAAWADEHDHAVMRWFDVDMSAGWEPAGISDGTTARRRSELRVVVAYPENWAQYGSLNGATLGDVLDADLEGISKTIGINNTGSVWPAGSCPVFDELEGVDRGEGVVFATHRIEFEYFVTTHT